MHDRAPPLRILVTNDDGARADGLKVLERIARHFTDDVWVVVPEFDQSGVAHGISLHEPLRIHQEDERRFFVNGTPADCVLLATEHLIEGRRPDLVLSGVNRGGNIADAISYSGTVGAALTALLLKIPAIALSQLYRDVAAVHWETAERFAPDLVRRIREIGWHRPVVYNINFPAVAPEKVEGVAFCRPGQGMIGGVHVDERVDARHRPYCWISFRRSEDAVDDPNSDIVVLRQGKIAISPLRQDRHAEEDWLEMGRSIGPSFEAWFRELA